MDMEETTKNLCQDGLSLGPDSKPGHPTYKVGVLNA